eukprot:6193418-Pleurochrysis_carterae.AAC.2
MMWRVSLSTVNHLQHSEPAVSISARWRCAPARSTGSASARAAARARTPPARIVHTALWHVAATLV